MNPCAVVPIRSSLMTLSGWAPLLFLLPTSLAAQDRRLVPAETPSPAETETATFEVPIEVRTQSGPRSSSAAVPRIAVELGVAREPCGPRFGNSPVLARAESDEEGRILTTLDVPLEWKEASGAWVWARVETPGYARRVVRKGLGSKSALGLWALRGGDVFGTVRRPSGEPVAQARVWLFEERQNGHDYRGGTRTDDAGRFAVSYGVDRTQGGRFVVHARASGVGSGRTAPIEPDPYGEAAPIELELGGGVRVEARVVDPAGDPVPGVLIAAKPAGLSTLADAEACFRAEGEGGLFGDFAPADEEGRVVFPALVPGEYTFYAAWGYLLGDPFGKREDRLGTRLSTLAVGAAGENTEPVQLTFAEHRIEVRITSPDGTPIDAFTRAEGRKPECRIAVERRFGGKGEWWSSRGIVTPVGRGAVVPVEPDQEYLVAWNHPSHPYVEERVAVPWGRFRTSVELRPGIGGDEARLTVHVLDPDGRKRRGDATVNVFSTESGRRVKSSLQVGPISEIEDGTWETVLPPGRFRLEADAEEHPTCLVSEDPPRPPYCPAVEQIALVAGQRSVVELVLGPAGHLDFVAMDPRTEFQPEDESSFEAPGSTRFWLGDLGRSALGGGDACVVGADGRRIEGLAVDVHRGFAWSDWIVPGWTARCLTPLPPGRWTLRVEDPNERLFEREVVIREGGVTVVRW